MIKRLQAIYQQRPFAVILFTGLLVRLLAAFFSKGYGMHDDHFLVIEAGQSIAAGHDYNNWLPWNSGGVPSGHSWFYVGIHIGLFKIFQFLNIQDPQFKMLLIRILHACYSLIVIVLGYRIVRKAAGEEPALKTAWLLAILWFMPNMSVRNLVEWVCVPPLMASTWALLRYRDEGKVSQVALAGFWAGIAMGIRFQTMFFFAGVGIYLLLNKQFRDGIICLVAWFVAFALTQSADLFLYGRPFVEMGEYLRYNFVNATTYFDRPWYMYFLTLGGMLIPPVSLFLFTGYVKSAKKLLFLFIPSLCFFVFHSYFPNKQERFILPFVPYLIMGGIVGWQEISANWSWKKFERGSWRFFMVLNTLALLVLCTMYSKRSRVEAMYYLYDKPDFNNFLVEASHTDSEPMMPQYYSGKWQKAFGVSSAYTVQQFNDSVQQLPAGSFPNYILFFEDEKLPERVATFESVTHKKLELQYEASPSYMDDLLHFLNKHNRNQPVFIYHVGTSQP